jgi:hypothetical protein
VVPSHRERIAPCLAAISSISSMTIRFSSICALATPKYGAHSYLQQPHAEQRHQCALRHTCSGRA